ncbi:hypothetical protein KFL_007430065 [Klebsormidium nitens]|uniref:Uncharacterized protein n=1 Tax=Klebsormidium nitens TaxID=105231 RepID=A0A1Y1INZ3_KLENI|nr:hypothetical protein KFL_007430065 [Klebsormidium nitens]|eukprot:GAQ91209.1 hypothetical protein KFL_007430065 [Klebsormidium nitens]
MDPRDLESLVEQCAAMLLSDDVNILDKGIQILRGKYIVTASKQAEQLARIAQEIAVYNGGVVLKKLWEGLQLRTSEGCPKPPTTYSTGCNFALSILSSNKVVVERCLKILGAKERLAARDIYRTLSGMAVQEARSLKRIGAAVEGPSFNTLRFGTRLRNICNFAEASRVFREGMKDVAEEQSIFETLGYLVSPEFLSKLTAFDSWKLRDLLSRLVESLAIAKDSQLWALDKGLLKLIAAILEGSPVKEPNLSPNFKPDGSPNQSCAASLVFLLETEAGVEKMRAHNALSGLKPHKQKINGAPLNRSWNYIETRMQGKHAALGALRYVGRWKLKQSGDGYVVLPVVCSWKLCTAGPETAGKKFGKCALCQVSRYCRL